MIVELIDMALDLVGDLAQVELMLRFGWPRARAWLGRCCTQIACLSAAAFEESPSELEELDRAAADESLRAVLSGSSATPAL